VCHTLRIALILILFCTEQFSHSSFIGADAQLSANVVNFTNVRQNIVPPNTNQLRQPNGENSTNSNKPIEKYLEQRVISTPQKQLIIFE
jgi:hypothetical protein